MNKVIIIGVLAVDPEGRTTQSGISQSSFRVAVQRAFKGANGERETDFLTVVAWRQSAEYANKFLHKGDKVAVEGSIQTRSYEAKDGQKRLVTEIVADRVEGLGNRTRDEQTAPSTEQRTDLVEVTDDELPFD